jgi:hypothetical protein
LVLVSCEKEKGLDTINQSTEKQMIDFCGLKVKLPTGYDEKVLSLNLSDLQGNYYSNKSKFGLKSASSDEMDITLEEMDNLVTSVLIHYPNTDSLTERDIEIIQNDFNGIDEIKIYENIDVIDSFYNALIRYDYVDTLSKHYSLNLKSTNDYLGYDVSKAEFWALVWHPRLVKPTRSATDKAIELTGQYFPGQAAWRTKADAFRHAIWNALIAKYVGDKKNKIDECVDWAKKFTDKHEEGAERPADMTQEDFDFDKAMDYHNNKIGRDYFKSVAWTDKRKWYQPTRVKAPSETTMADAIFEKTKVAKKVSSKSQINSYPSNLVYIKD